MSVDLPTAAAHGLRTAPVRLRTAIATVCLSGTLEDKLEAASAAGFDGVEIFEPDFIASPWSAGRVRAQCADLGLSVDLYQPFRDFDSARPEVVQANLRRADRKFDVMHELGTDLILVCSSVSEDCATDDDQIAEQLYQLASAAAVRGMRISYEALAWARYVSTYEHSWDIVRKAGHPALGLCLDSFHILSRGSDPAGIEQIPADKLFFLQLADAPHLEMDVLQWSRHYRLFPGQGTFDLPAFLNHVMNAGYTGPLSLEVFNDVFRQADPRRAAVDGRRSLLALQEATFGALPVDGRDAHVIGGGGPALPDLGGFAFAELVVDQDDRREVGDALECLGFAAVGHHRTKPVELWQQGEARVLINGSASGAAVGALGIETADAAAAAERAQALLAPLLPRTRGSAEADLAAVGAPDGTSLFFCRTGVGDATSWLSDFTGDGVGEPSSASKITHIDHVALTQPYDRFDEAALFYRSVLGLRTQRSSEVAAPFGLVRNRAVVDPKGLVRICLSVSVLRRGNEWHPGVTDPQHVAFATADVIATARAARAAGLHIIDIPANYYDDLDARLALPSELLEAARELGLLYDRGPEGDFLHFYTRVLGGRVFFEVVQRSGGYQGYGETNGPIRMAAHRRDASARRAKAR